MTLTSREYWAKSYSASLRSRSVTIDPSRSYFADDFLRLITPYLPVATQKHAVRLLEMGCGNSLWLPYFAKKLNYVVSGIDYTEDGCRLAEANLSAVGRQGDIYCRDFCSLGDEF